MILLCFPQTKTGTAIITTPEETAFTNIHCVVSTKKYAKSFDYNLRISINIGT